MVAPKGVWSIPELHALVQGATPAVHPDAVRNCVELIMGQIEDLQTRVQTIEKAIRVAHRASEVSLRLQTIPGIGVITASAITATIGDIKVFKSGQPVEDGAPLRTAPRRKVRLPDPGPAKQPRP